VSQFDGERAHYFAMFGESYPSVSAFDAKKIGAKTVCNPLQWAFPDGNSISHVELKRPALHVVSVPAKPGHSKY
jgi:hypothetical protein